MDVIKHERSQSSIEKLAAFFHTSLLIHHCYVYFYVTEKIDFDSSNIEIVDLETYRLCYLTTWNMFLQSFYLFLAVYIDIVKLTNCQHKENKLFRNLEAIKTYFFSSLVFPTGLLVCTFFWFVFNIDRELIYPQDFDSVVPVWVNHSIHTAIVALPFIEILFQKEVPSFRSAIKGMTVFTLLYNTTYFLTYYQSSRWLYKVFYIFSWPERVGLVIAIYLVTALILWLGVIIQKRIIDKKYQEILFNKNIFKKLL